jgi:hypothetical protein
VPREPAEPATAIGSSDGPMQQKSRQSKVQMRLFDPPEVPLESIDEGTDVDRHDTPEHDEPEPGTPHDSGDERIVDGEEAIHGAT